MLRCSVEGGTTVSFLDKLLCVGQLSAIVQPTGLMVPNHPCLPTPKLVIIGPNPP